MKDEGERLADETLKAIENARISREEVDRRTGYMSADFHAALAERFRELAAGRRRSWKALGGQLRVALGEGMQLIDEWVAGAASPAVFATRGGNVAATVPESRGDDIVGVQSGPAGTARIRLTPNADNTFALELSLYRMPEKALTGFHLTARRESGELELPRRFCAEGSVRFPKIQAASYRLVLESERGVMEITLEAQRLAT